MMRTPARRLPKVGILNQMARAMLGLTRRAAPSNYFDYQTKTRLALPFAGEWYVYWGGRTIRQNYHAMARDQRFAHDFLMLSKGRSFQGSGEQNEEYFCFAQSIFAPANGIVVAAVNDQPDRNPGQMLTENPLGNHVILDHGGGEFSFLVHLKQNSAMLFSGDQVSAGQKIGECGNSGHTSEPHLHYHLQNTAVPFRGEGLPVQFLNFFADGEPIDRGEPIAGQTVGNSN